MPLLGGRVALVAAVVAMAGCAPPPSDEFRAYIAASDQAGAAADDILDAYAPFERSNGAAVAGSRGGSSDALELDMAVYYATIGDPPLVESARRGLATLDDYNMMLTLYAEGRSFALVEPHINAFVSNVEGLASTLSVAGPGTGIAATTTLSLLLEPPLAIYELARSAGDRERFGSFVLETRPYVLDLFGFEKEVARTLFDLAVEDIKGAPLPPATDPEAVRNALLERQALVADHRQAIANHIVLLGQAERAFMDLTDAVQYGTASPVDAADLAAWSERLREGADNVRASVIALRNGN